MKVLIIQQKMIGDVLATSILFEAIKQQYPNAELHYVINSHTYPVVENNHFIDVFKFFTPEHEKSKQKLYVFAKQLQKEKYDVVIDVYSKLSSNLITLFSKAKTKISKHKKYTSIIYTHTFKDATTTKTNAGLAIENRLQLLAPLNINASHIVKPKIYLTNTEKDQAKQFLLNNSIDLQKPLYMIGVLGSGSSKTYPFEYMAKVINNIVEQQPNAQLLFNYIPKQITEAKAIFNFCSPSTKKQIYFDVFGKSLRQFLAITSHCNALIGNEGGAINMAKALNIPTFTIFSPWIKKEAWNMFDDGKKHVSVHLNDYHTEYYKNVEHPKQLKTEAAALYTKLKPSLFNDALNVFLKAN
ncbi:glycosyltransferase family 9 protein [Seonamhaeicola algicola]|uniref:Glycosyltransferase family 9 protein n=1 Tax=Seonamhaeicola algicola TaxID=1719036 RepID=A0A5C7AGK6_9FLAO|nr:glycosyltransferase family 9 protein [Seonamhaeicola algicola]TXE07069.1 glycosyltransferase family 9 protein [Seonamhaeicola algicola]